MIFSTPYRRWDESGVPKMERYDHNENKNVFDRNFRFSIFDVEILHCYHIIHEDHGKYMKIDERS